MSLTIQKAQIQDIPILNQISIESKMHWNYPSEWMEEWIEEMLLSEEDLQEQSIFKLSQDKSPIGFCAILARAYIYEVTHLWIRPQFIGQGYGKFLLNQSLSEVVNKPKEIIVIADPNAEAFYARQGFITFKTLEGYPQGRILPVMKKAPTKQAYQLGLWSSVE